MNIDGELMLGESTTVFLSDDDEVPLTVVGLRFVRTLRLNLSTPFSIFHCSQFAGGVNSKEGSTAAATNSKVSLQTSQHHLSSNFRPFPSAAITTNLANAKQRTKATPSATSWQPSSLVIFGIK